MPGAGAIPVELRRSQAVHERAGLASYEPEYDPEGLTIEAAIELAACITRSPWPGSVLSGVEAVARADYKGLSVSCRHHFLIRRQPR